MISVSLVYNRKKVSGNTASIEVRITHARKSSYISTGVRVRKSEWRNGLIVNRPDSYELNDRLNHIVSNIQRIANEYIESGRALDVVAIKKKAWNMQTDDEQLEVYEWMQKQIPMLNLAPKTKNRYMILYDRIVEFGMFKTWDDVNADNLYEFDAWLHQRQSQDGRGMISDAGVYNYHKCFKALLNRAMRIGVIDANPYNRLRGEFKRGDQESFEYLTEDEMKAFEALRPVPGTVAAKARDLFVFQMYTGLSYSDAQAFNIRNYKLVDGRWRYNGKRIKTGVPYVSELLPPVIDVLERNGWKVPKIENGFYNKILKVLGMAAGIQTRFHSHLARHTFATWVLSKHVDIQNVAKMLGQKDIKTTQRYAKVLAESVHDDFERLGSQFDVSDTK